MFDRAIASNPPGHLPAQLREQPDRGLLDELVLAVGVGAHGVFGASPASSSATVGTAPFKFFGSESTSLVT